MSSPSRIVLTAAIAAAPLLLAACSADRPTAEPAAAVAVESAPGPDECPADPRQTDDLFGRAWLLGHDREPVPGVTLRRCHYSNTPNGTDLVPPSSNIIDADEVRKILLALPDSTDVGHRCGPGGDDLLTYTFDEYTVLDPSGTPVAAFQAIDGNPCGIHNVVPTA
ncbi:hypothetical protein [Prescottella subtropica]|uniref:hypothetical protein n=1 Tax=Prescottella subtropica TaxID=2545757 RepID=UPI0010F8ECD6|nr:hypothetical protein [Prescottella subtropica]